MSSNLVYISQPNFSLEDRIKKVKQSSLCAKKLENNSLTISKLKKKKNSHKNYLNEELNFSAVII